MEFTTAAFLAMGNLAGEFGFADGFDYFFELFRDKDVFARRKKVIGSEQVFSNGFSDEIALPLAEDINGRLIPWIDENKNKNTFSFVWTIDVHEPYSPPVGFRRYSGSGVLKRDEGGTSDIRSAGYSDRQRLINLYDDEILYNDFCLGEIVQYLIKENLYNDSLILVLGDHGESFFEHGVYSHGHMPYEEIINVPLVIKFPNNKYAGRRIQEITELIDIFPTIVETVNNDSKLIESVSCQGNNLVSLLEGGTDNIKKYSFSETKTLEVHNRYLSARGMRWKYIRIEKPHRDTSTIIKTIKHIFERRMIGAIVRSPNHFIKNFFSSNDEFLFDLENDPGEKNNLVKVESEKLDWLRKELADWINQNEMLSHEFTKERIDLAEKQLLQKHLEKLGYM
jgi:arylsulfatase A-like enzyme